MASFASLGDVIIAEPKNMIGSAAPRVIKETTHQDLPERFQTAEFLQQHGLIDIIVHRKKLREEISRLSGYFAVAACRLQRTWCLHLSYHTKNRLPGFT